MSTVMEVETYSRKGSKKNHYQPKNDFFEYTTDLVLETTFCFYYDH